MHHQGVKETKAMATRTKTPITSSEVLALLRAKYPAPEWASAAEVRDKTGFGARRSCDFMAMQTFPSKGLYMHGHEIKVSRSDWLREIQDPTKAAAFDSRCHFWWIVAPPGVLEIDELPGRWGYLQATKKTLRVKKAAALAEPQPLDYEFFASLARSMQVGGLGEQALNAIRSEAYERGRQVEKERSERNAGYDLRQARRELETIKENVAAFEKSSGVTIHRWDGESIGEAVAVLRAAQATPAKTIANAIATSEQALKSLHAVRDAVAALASPPAETPST